MSLTCTLFVTTSATDVQKMTLKCPAFANNGMIPQKYTTEGDDINPQLLISNTPAKTKSLVLIFEDPSAPVDTWVHWLVWDILPTSKIDEGTIPGTEGVNSFMLHRYKGPCPPAGTRNYIFRVYALNTMLHQACHATKYDIMKAMKDHVIGYGELTGTYIRKNFKSIPNLAVPAPDIYC